MIYGIIWEAFNAAFMTLVMPGQPRQPLHPEDAPRMIFSKSIQQIKAYHKQHDAATKIRESTALNKAIQDAHCLPHPLSRDSKASSTGGSTQQQIPLRGSGLSALLPALPRPPPPLLHLQTEMAREALPSSSQPEPLLLFASVLGVLGQLTGLSPGRASASGVAASGSYNQLLGATLLHDSSIKGRTCVPPASCATIVHASRASTPLNRGRQAGGSALCHRTSRAWSS